MVDRGGQMRPGRNDPCPCGSRRRYKRCCGQLNEQVGPAPGPIALAHLMQALQGLLHEGRNLELEVALREALRAHPSNAVLWQLLGIALARQGKDPIPAYGEAVACAPSEAAAHVNLANALARSGRLSEAEARYEQALELDPRCAEACTNLAELYLELNQPDAALACARRALEISDVLLAARMTEATALLNLGRLDEATASSEHALKLDPQGAEAHDLRGCVFLARGEPEAAIASFDQALRLTPGIAAVHANRARALRSLGRLEEAISGYGQALQLRPSDPALHAELATTLRLGRRALEAEGAARTALAIAPDSTAAHVVLAELAADFGRFADAQKLFGRAIELDSGCVEAWVGLTRVRRLGPEDAPWVGTAARLAAQPLPASREMLLRYALGKCLDDLGDYPGAFANFARANEIGKRSAPAFDRAGLSRLVERIVDTQGPAWLNASRDRHDGPRRPIFVIGMLRSGTSLAEQILASHPEVFGAGERSFWGDRAVAAIAGRGLTDAELLELGRQYLAHVDAEAPAGATWVVDKLPTNFLWLGVIRAALPQARFIHLRRDPRDTCLSIYFQNFEAINAYTHDLADLAHYYRQYRHLMAHWCAALPAEVLLEVPYESLVHETVQCVDRMLRFLDLPWDVRCLEFDRTERQVVTASRWQVRQKIYSSSIGRWRHYSEFLGPLAELTEPGQ
ncbi:MAG: sulfotransferase [Proteobacteria bacterium]|nr:sulfotransferase [Pseudomonadota bacterium]